MRALKSWLGRVGAFAARHPYLVVLLFMLAVGLLTSASAWARVGGGESFSSGSSSGSSSSDDDSDLILFLIWLCIEHPTIGIPVTIIVIIVAIVRKARAPAKQDWTSGVDTAPADWTPPQSQSPRRQLEQLRTEDPQFSTVLFEDFLYALYAAAQEGRGSGQMDSLGPYLSKAARGRFHPAIPGAPPLLEVKDVIVGAMRILRVVGPEPASPSVRVTVRFETNFTQVTDDGRGGRRETALYASEIWYLSRQRGVKSRPPERARKIGCPSCGAALEAIRGNTCSYCQKVVDTGAFDWRVESIDLIKKEIRPPVSGGGGAEGGTNRPTLTAPDALTNLEELEKRDPAFTFDGFRARAELIFRELQAAWTDRDWMRVRPYASDSLFQMQLYWIDGFKRQKVRNVIDGLKVERMETAAVVSDAHYDAITLRIFASCLDYVISEDGKQMVRGSRSSPTRFSEYWTFIRGTGAKGMPSVEKKCPGCGAPQKINQAGSCEFCKAKITSGEFDWVLSRIEQDDVYAG
jgi:predicted lipid-binding transport protein (Tim44 family)